MRLFNVNPRTFIAIGHDIVVAALVWTFTFSLRWNFELDRSTQIILFQTLPAVLAVQVGCFVYFGLYRGIWRYASIHDMRLIAMSVGTSALIIPILLLLWRNGLGVPRSLYFLNPLLLILFMCAGRLLYRWWKEKAMGAKGVEPQPVILLGAGNAALSLIDELNRNPYWYVIGVLDDNPNKVGRQMGGVRILGHWEQLEQIARDSNCKHAVLAVGATNHATRRRVFELCERAHIKLLVIPDVQELMSGQVKVSQIRYVDVDDLLGRDPVSLDTGGLRQMLEGKSVLVTGGGGSIGSELCRQIARFKPGQIIIYELSEFALYRVTEDLKRAFPEQRLVPIVGDIKDAARLQEIFERHRPTIVYHAAAYKHVPILEENNAWQAVRNNAWGTRVLADVASRFDIERFVYISSDKAVNPTNVMGATKRLAEMILQYQHSMATLPMVLVRFGNVLGSSGSVIPKFREQIANGGPITVTHPDITRYFMSIPEATQLVLQAGLMGRGGETFVLDMGQPIRIVDLARTMVRLSGYTEADIPIAFTGLRPGEKLFEELLADNEKTLPTPHAKLRVSRPIDPPGTSWDISVKRWLESPGPVGDAEVRQMLTLWVPEYKPAPLYPPVATPGARPATLPSATETSPAPDAGATKAPSTTAATAPATPRQPVSAPATSAASRPAAAPQGATTTAPTSTPATAGSTVAARLAGAALAPAAIEPSPLAVSMLRDPVAQPIPVNRQTPTASPAVPDTTPAPLAESRQDDAVQSREELAALLPDNDALLARLKHLAQVATRTETADEPVAASAEPTTPADSAMPAESVASPTPTASSAAAATTSQATEATPVAEEAAAPAEMDAEPETQNKVQARPAEDEPAKADAVAPEQEATATAEAADAEPAAAATADAPEAEADADEPADTTPTQPAAKAAKGSNRRGRKRKH
ncbi:nucleoside-diphosphate sugar epimerase/dehydratase [Lautropia mirabilis ATCC 51599]|uniref:Polysaccharide biosynthesis protein n=1 Tax=Lautropia mirabilis ATCC 51599 TaxID=887898 RepID=E7RU90_9BURK|nr:nucleoside-diphosphate sugar epimerase/dehydratase [Lautropia mirabilis]EFV95873.1 polysaccharide biosynthesis protein [Lautropia mirabilis ATCC 51599]VEH03809.1 UDP-glucose 4-epimerase [Lautropia mirabilis]